MTAPSVAHLYKITDTARGSYYVGKHKGTEQNGYWGSGRRIMRHVKKYGKADLKYEILVIAQEQYIYDLEKKYMQAYECLKDPQCLNLCNGGVGGNLGGEPYNKGKPTPPEVRKKQSLAKLGKPGVRRGIPHSEETLQKLRSWKRHPVTEETRLKLSAAHKGRKQKLITCPHCGKVGGVTAMPRWHMNRCKHKGE